MIGPTGALNLPARDEPIALGTAQFAALKAFGQGDCIRDRQARARPDDRLGVIDDVMDQVASAARQLRREAEEDLAITVPSRASSGQGRPVRIEQLEAELSGQTSAECRMLAMLAYRRAELGQDAERAANLAARALSGGLLLAEGVRSTALFAAGTVLGLTGRLDQAEALFGQIAEQARRTRSLAAFAASCAQRGVERYRRGALAEAVQDLSVALDATRGRLWETMIDDGRSYLIRVDVDRGRLGPADGLLHAWCATGPLPDSSLGNRLLIERARLRLAQGRCEEAATDAEAAGRRLADLKDSVLFEWRPVAALARHQLGHHDSARLLAEEELDRAKIWGAPRQLGIAVALLGVVEGRWAGIKRMQEALEILDQSSAQLERARIQVSLGAALRRQGQPSRARRHLRLALEVAARCGAAAIADRARQELAATGITRSRRTFLSGPEALTPSEQRVARLAAGGRSNPDIARELFVTRKTVEMHLGSVYRKLQIESRHQLRSALSCAPAI
jgi:DNA-binding CsgD family transcriptional regulator